MAAVASSVDRGGGTDALVAVALTGPTASGKSALALALAARFPVEIVSVDSAQVYRGLDIGTAKPPPEVRARIPHHLVDVCDPAEPYSAARFQEDALRAIRVIRARGRIPLLVGGTMLYFRALEQGLSPLPAADPGVRAELESEARRRGWPALHAELARVDPEAAARIHPNDPQRIQRALEVYRLTGRPLTELQRAGVCRGRVRLHKAAVAPPGRERLRARIAERFDCMLKEGLVEEVARLRARADLHPELPAIKAVGYRQVWRHLAGELSYGEMRAQAIMATCQLAKRQLTWLRADGALRWFQGEPEAVLPALAAWFRELPGLQ